MFDDHEKTMFSVVIRHDVDNDGDFHEKFQKIAHNIKHSPSYQEEIR